MIEYPKVLYRPDPADHKQVQSQKVADAAAEAALGKGWSENPGGEPEKAGTGIDTPPPAAVKAAAHVPQEYPKVLYRKVDGKIESSRVENKAAEAALGKGWHEDTDGEPIPAPAPAEPAPAKPKARRKKAA